MKKIFVLIMTALFLCAGAQGVVYAESVMYNTQTQKVHKINCKWAKKCTVNCIKIERKDAYNKKGGKPCKVCGG